MATFRAVLEFYAEQGVISSPGRYADWFDLLPNRVPEIVGVVQGLVLHAYWVGHYGISLTAEQEQHVNARHMQNILEIILSLDDSPLTVSRPYEKRLFGTCRDFSLFLTAALRHKGIPARCRCGFGRYFMPNSYEDHWIVEYWHAGEGRWVALDPQIDELQRSKLKLTFDPLRLPKGQFVSGAEAWQLWREGKEVEPNKFGIADFRGFLFLYGNLVRELAALNKVELLPWDVWGLMRKEELEESDYILLDEVAGLIIEENESLFAIYEMNQELRPPASLTNLAK